jgi:hypothetical protein
VWVIAAIAGLWMGPRGSRVASCIAAVAVCLPYAFFVPFDHWETLRFLLPVVVLFSLLAAKAVVEIARRVAGSAVAPTLAGLGTALVAVTWMSWLSSHQVLTMPVHEARHRIAADFVRESTRANAVVLANQHSGSLRLYAARQTANWDRIPAGALPGSVRALQDAGFDVYVMIDSEAERALFDARHGPVLATDAWLPAGQRRSVQLWEARRK